MNKEKIKELSPWCAKIHLGNNIFTKEDKSPTLEAKQSLIYDILEDEFNDNISNLKILDIGSNNGYTSAEGYHRGCNIVAIERLKENYDKCKFVF